ncbi:MAG: hypothetical protein M3O50_13515 [Myxococcota bacterium]|nr:hypothetical protein [Myxococcota bacterium]
MAPFVAVALSTRGIVPHLGDLIAHRFAVVGSVVRGVAPASRADDARPDDAAPAPPLQPPVPTSTAPVRWRISSRLASLPPAIVLPVERLSRLTASQLGRIRGVDAVDANGHPIGVRLSGVQALGLGLREGDIVTSLDGHPTPTLDDGTVVAKSALGSGRRNAPATILRDGQVVAVMVQLPRVATE